jgi:small subunit ribosomal protein S6
MAKYELLYILPAKQTDEETKTLKDSVTAELDKLGLKISRNEEIGKIKLGYAMKHVRYGHYILVDFDAEPAALEKITRFFSLRNDVLRFQITKPEPGSKPFAKLADPEARYERREPVPVMAAPRPAVSAPALTQEEIDKKLSALEEDITKEL